MGALVKSEDVLSFWIEEAGQSAWYEASDELDETIRDRFLSTWEQAKTEELHRWPKDAKGALAYVVLLDQFPRNMFRGQARAFSTDKQALCAAKCAISKDWDMKIAEPQRQFFYLPLMHSESLSDQDRCIRLIKQRMPETGESNLLHARAHREVIRRFGRFPYRNDALGRSSTAQEIAYMNSGGYGSTVKELQTAA